MKVPLLQLLYDLPSFKPIKIQDGDITDEDGRVRPDMVELTVGKVLVGFLSRPKDGKDTHEARLARYRIAHAIATVMRSAPSPDEGMFEADTKDAAVLLDIVQTHASVVLIGQLLPLVDGKVAKG